MFWWDIWVNHRLRKLSLQFLVPFAVLIHTICSAQFPKLLVVGTADRKRNPLRCIHRCVVKITEFQLGYLSLTSRTELFVAVQHMNPLATLTVVHVHHEKFPFSHNPCKVTVCLLPLYYVSWSGQSQAYISDKCRKMGVKYRAIIA